MALPAVQLLRLALPVLKVLADQEHHLSRSLLLDLEALLAPPVRRLRPAPSGPSLQRPLEVLLAPLVPSRRWRPSVPQVQLVLGAPPGLLHPLHPQVRPVPVALVGPVHHLRA
jgi:hypothetical protein